MNAEATQVVVASTEDGISNNGTTNGVTQHALGTSDGERTARASFGEVKTEETVNRAMQHLAAGKRHIDGKLACEMLKLAKTILDKHFESIGVCLRYHRAVSAADDKEAEERAKLKDDAERKVSNAFQTLGESSMETEETANMAIINMAAGKRPYISPFKLAIEDFELAAVINAIQRLVELSMENENYQQVIEDLQTCLARRQQIMPEDSGCIAATHRIGVAQSLNIDFDEVICEFNEAIKVLELRIERLKSEAESVDPTKVADAFSTRENEIKEIESLIPKIREKVADTKDMKIEAHNILREKRLMEEGIATFFTSGDGGSLNGDGLSKATSTISTSLIRKPSAVDSAPSDGKKAHIDVEDKE